LALTEPKTTISANTLKYPSTVPYSDPAPDS
jgi:hypothetical protein